MLQDDVYDLVVLDELTYMLGYKYLDGDQVVQAITERPVEQSIEETIFFTCEDVLSVTLDTAHGEAITHEVNLFEEK